MKNMVTEIFGHHELSKTPARKSKTFKKKKMESKFESLKASKTTESFSNY
jgi:hypothetical protein